VTKADLGDVALRARRDLASALRSLGSRATKVLAVASLPPPEGVDALADALDEHRAATDVAARRLRARRLAALDEFTVEHGERALRALGGRREAERWLREQDEGLDVPGLVALLERRAAAD
jgi:LAO/AO transport system kinase